MLHWGRTTTSRTRRPAIAVVVLTLVAASCGNRRSHDEISAAAGRATTASDGSRAASGSALESAGPTGTAASDAPLPSTRRTATSAPPPASAGASSSAAGPAGVPGALAIAGPRSVIRLGSVGTTSGVGGTQLASIQAMQAWAKSVNDRGGVAGHPVQIVAVDDGMDPARFRAALQELIDQRGVLAFLGNLSGFTLSDGAVQYLEQKRVPVVGGDRLQQLWNESPMLFPQAAAGDAIVWNHMVNTARIGGKGAAVGWVACQEAQICRDADRLWQQYAPRLGLRVVFRATVSVAQPSFTAECVRAQQAGVKLFLLGTDANSSSRIVMSCARQGFHPRYGVLQTSDNQAKVPEFDGGYFGSMTFPWVSEDSPGAHEFQQVMRERAPGVVLSAHAASGWVAAKLFEHAGANLGEPPTRAQLLQGLWAIHDDTLDGLTAPITFVREKRAPPSYCVFPMEIRGRRWIGSAKSPICRPPS